MQRCLLAGKLALAATALGMCFGGCGSRTEGPPTTTAPGAKAQTAPRSPADRTAAGGEPSARIELTLSCPEEVDVGQQYTAEIVIANRGRAATGKLLLVTRFDSAVQPSDSAGSTERDLGKLEPGESRRIDVTLRATEAGTFAHTAEVKHDAEVLASQWTTVTAIGPQPKMAKAEPPGEPPEEAGPDLGPPLVDNPDALERLHPSYPIWFAKATKSVVMMGTVCQRRAPLELFACLRGSKEHESVVEVPIKAYVLHAGLLAAGAEPGGPVRFEPEYTPPRGPEVEVRVIWKDEKGEKHQARAQQWVRNMRTGKAMSAPWVFAGSRFVQDETTGERFYLADTNGDLICVANFPSAVLDVPVASTDSDAGLMFDAFTENIPPRGTPVTLVLTPKLEKRSGDTDPSDR